MVNLDPSALSAAKSASRNGAFHVSFSIHVWREKGLNVCRGGLSNKFQTPYRIRLLHLEGLFQNENVFAIDMVVGIFRHDLFNDGDA